MATDDRTGVARSLEWARTLQAIAQSGLRYADDPFDIERYEVIRRIASEMTADHLQLDVKAVAEIFGQQVGDATPKVDVRGVVFDDARLLLVREKVDEGRWTVPGGWADVGESPARATEREVREESGYIVRATKLLAVYDKDLHDHPPSLFHTYKLFVRCDLVGGGPADSHETEGAHFFSEVEVPELSTARVTRAQVARLFDHLRNPEWPTDFD